MFYDGVSIGVNVLAILLFLLGLKMLFRAGWIRAWLRGTSGVFVLAAAAFFALLALDIRGYQQWQKDEPLAKVSFSKTGDQQYEAVVVFVDELTPKVYALHGDQWQIDARILRPEGWLGRIGGKPGYRFERISGRYDLVSEEAVRPRSVFALTEPSGHFDVWHWIYKAGGLPGVEATYGSATFVPMADGAFYSVELSQSGLTIRPLNEEAKATLLHW